MPQERIDRVAIRMGDTTYAKDRPARHITLIHWLLDRERLGPQEADEWITMPAHEQGFLTSTGRFVDRREALQIATDAGQMLAPPSPTGELFSEDVW